MTVQSSFFGVTKLTGEDSDKFRKQVSYGRPSQAAIDSLKRGQGLLKSMDNKGHVKLKIKRKR